MLPTPEEQLLQMSISGKLPPDLQRSFDAERTKGNTAYREAQYHDAIGHYNEAELINPMSPVPPANRSMVYIKLNQFEKAKQEAAVAHELHQALPAEERSNKLLVKILLRRATANKQLLLLALAAEDYQAVLDIEENDVARKELTTLKHEYNLKPVRRTGSTGKDLGNRIQVVEEKLTLTSANNSAVRAQSSMQGKTPSRLPQTPLSSNVQDETALVQLPKSVMENLVSKWSSVPPRTPDEFERVWRSLHDDTLAQSKYLIETVGHTGIKKGVLGDSLTPQLLERFVSVLAAAVKDDPAVSTEVAHILQALTSVSRFEMLLMFLSPAEKKPVATLLESLRANDVPLHQIRAIEQSYT